MITAALLTLGTILAGLFIVSEKTEKEHSVTRPEPNELESTEQKESNPMSQSSENNLLTKINVRGKEMAGQLSSRYTRWNQARQDGAAQTNGGDANASSQKNGSGEEKEAGLLDQVTANARILTERISSAVGRPSELPAQFRSWTQSSLSKEPLLKEWLDSLNDDQFVALTEHVADYCEDVGFELAWLVGTELTQNPHLVRGAAQVVVLYCEACHQAALIQTELETFKRYRDYLHTPTARRNQSFGERLLERLIQSDLTAVSISDYLVASPKERQEQVLAAIRQAENQDRGRFNQVLASVVFEGQQPLTHAESESPTE